MLCGVLAVLTLALGLTTFASITRLRSDLRREIGAEFEALAKAEVTHLADILSEQLSILRSIALAETVTAETLAANGRYSGGEAVIQSQLLGLDAQWRNAPDDAQLVQSIVDAQSNPLARQLLRYQAAFPHHVEIFLTDRHGALLAATHRTSDFFQADEEWWQAAYNDGRGAFHVGQPAYDESAAHTALIMSAPIRSHAGDVIGVASTTFRTGAIHEAIAGVHFGHTGHLSVVGPTGVVIADPDPEHVGMQAAPSCLAHITGATSGWHDMADDEGVPLLAGHAPIAGAGIEHEAEADAIRELGWTLFVTQSQAEAYGPVRRAILIDATTAVVAILLAAALASVVGRFLIVAPLTRLAAAARRIASGDLTARVRFRRRDEMGLLAQAFNTMAHEIASSVGALERRVADRTEQLAAERERLSVTLNSIGDGVIAVDMRGCVTLTNHVAQSLTGYSQKEALGQPLEAVFSIVDEDTRQPAADPVAQVLREGQVTELADHTLLIARDGTERVIADSAAPIRRADGDILGVVLVFRDVSEERRIQRQITQLAMIAQQAGEGIAVADVDGCLSFVNTAWAQMHDYEPKELIGKHLSVFHSEQQMRSDVIPCIERVERTGRFTGEIAHIRRDGTPFPTRMTTTLLRDERGQPVGSISFATDISERKRAEAALRESERKYRELVTTSIDGVICADARMRVTVWNEGAERILGYTQSEMLGRDLTHVIPYRYREAKQKGFAAFRESGSGPVIGQIVELEGLRKDGTEVPVELSISSSMVNGAPILTGIVRDITERKQAEEALRRRTEQLVALREVGLEITGQLDLDAVLHSIVARSSELLDATIGGLYLYRPERDVIEMMAWGASEHTVPGRAVLRRGEGLSGKVWETGEPFIVDDYQQWEGRSPAWEDFPMVSVLGVPARWGPEGEEGEFLGVLNVAADRPGVFSSADAHLLSLFASQAAIAIQNARLYQAEQQRAGELEAAYEQLQRAQEALVKTERLAAMSQIGVTVRHEINNPLTAVLGNAQWLLMRDPMLSAESRDVAMEIEKASLRIRDVVRRLDEIEDRPVPYLDVMMIDIHGRSEQ